MYKVELVNAFQHYSKIRTIICDSETELDAVINNKPADDSAFIYMGDSTKCIKIIF